MAREACLRCAVHSGTPADPSQASLGLDGTAPASGAPGQPGRVPSTTQVSSSPGERCRLNSSWPVWRGAPWQLGGETAEDAGRRGVPAWGRLGDGTGSTGRFPGFTGKDPLLGRRELLCWADALGPRTGS